VVELDVGGEVTVVRQNHATGSEDALGMKGRRVRVAWHPQHNLPLAT
jgi:hypothetical protein